MALLFAATLFLAAWTGQARALTIPSFDSSGQWEFTVYGSGDERLDGVYNIELFQKNFYLSAYNLDDLAPWSALIRENFIILSYTIPATTELYTFQLTMENDQQMHGTARLALSTCTQIAGTISATKTSNVQDFYTTVVPIPHLTKDDAFWSEGLRVTNASTDEEEAEYTIQLFDDAGILIDEQDYTLGALTSSDHFFKEIAPTATSGAISIHKRGVVAAMIYENGNGGTSVLPLDSLTSSRITMLNVPVMDDLAPLAVVACNSSGQDIDITFYALGGGEVLGESTHEALAWTRLALSLADLFPEVDPADITAVAVVGENNDDPLTGFLFVANLDQSRVFLNPGVAVQSFLPGDSGQ